jgi:cytochrome oxidase assembly protein ShyY1
VAIGVSAGHWQTRRGDDKQAIETLMAARATAAPVIVGDAPLLPEEIEFARIRVRGNFVTDWPLFLDNRPQQGKAGFYVLMPLKIEGSARHVLVARGWIPRNLADRSRLPDFFTPAGTVEIEGLARKNAGHVMQLGTAPKIEPRAILQNLELTDFAAASQLTLQPFILEQHKETSDGLVRDWPRPSSGIDKHRGYAFQWYGLALAALLFFIVTGFRRGSK